eukprot:SAG31_NODE_31241_length_370_cov_0.955720_1_plen_123_part_11
MSTYTAAGHVPGGNAAQLRALKHRFEIPPSQLAPAVGLVDGPGHQNASCEGWPAGRPRCANARDPACGCFNCSWNAWTFRRSVHDAEALGFEKIDVYRADAAPPPGTIPAWFVAELAGFLVRG